MPPPGITVEIVASNTLSDLRRREADIAVRNTRPADPELIAKKVRDDTAHLYATENYLARIGGLHAMPDMSRVDFIGFDDNDPFFEGLNALGMNLAPHNFPVLTGSHLVNWELVKQGIGVGVMATRIGDAEPLVRRAAPWLELFESPVWLVAHRKVKTSQRVRLIFDLLAKEIAAL